MSANDAHRILSIQSHVVSGYVGNKAAVFPLQLLGFDVDVVNSVHFSNHTGYAKGIQGDVLQGDQLREVLKGLQDNHLLGGIKEVLTGYIGSASFLEAVLEVIAAVRETNNCRYVCDPVLGDGGKFYVPESLVEVYRTKVLPIANVVTPNQFEVEQLTGIHIETLDDALKACRALHDMGPSLVFITSMILDETSDKMTIIASRRSQMMKDGGESEDEAWKIETPILDGVYTGTGDLTASLMLGHTAKNPEDLKGALEKVISTMQLVIQRTQQHAMQNAQTDDWKDDVSARELQLIQSKKDIEDPSLLFTAEQI